MVGDFCYRRHLFVLLPAPKEVRLTCKCEKFIKSLFVVVLVLDIKDNNPNARNQSGFLIDADAALRASL